MLHEELHGVARSVAHEALVDAESRADVHGGVFVIVEGTDAHEILTLFSQGDKIAHHLLDADGGHHTVYGFLFDHGAKIRFFRLAIVKTTQKFTT